VRVRLTFPSSKPVLFKEVSKRSDSDFLTGYWFSLTLELNNEGFTFH